MEKEIIVLIVVAILAIIVSALTLRVSYKRYQHFTYVHTKTGNKYRIIQKCLMKIDGKWKDAIVYVSELNGGMFIREYNDFMLKFKRLSEWKKEKN